MYVALGVREGDPNTQEPVDVQKQIPLCLHVTLDVLRASWNDGFLAGSALTILC